MSSLTDRQRHMCHPSPAPCHTCVTFLCRISLSNLYGAMPYIIVTGKGHRRIFVLGPFNVHWVELVRARNTLDLHTYTDSQTERQRDRER